MSTSLKLIVATGVKGLTPGFLGKGLSRGRKLFERVLGRRSVGWSEQSSIDVQSVAVPCANEVDSEILRVFQAPMNQRSFMIQWLTIAVQVLKDGFQETQHQRECLELLQPIRRQLGEIHARHLIPSTTPDFNQSKTGCLTLSITLGTPEETLDFFFRLWEFSLLKETGVRVHWTFDRSALRVQMKKFVPYTASWVMVDHFSRVFPQEGNTLCMEHFRFGYRTPAFAGLWSIFYGWMVWVSECGREVGGMVLPHPILSRFYIKSADGSKKYLHFVPDYNQGVKGPMPRVLATTISEREYISRRGFVSAEGTAFGGQVGILTSGLRW